MRPEIKEQWIAALRGGEYQQARGTLHDGEGFCCLGVLTDLAVKAGVCQWIDEGVEQLVGEESGSVYEDGGLAPAVRDWADVLDDDPKLGDSSASVWNDYTSADFNRIADLIEQHL